MTSSLRDRGAAAVEFALVVPILLTLVIGIIEFGRAYNIQTTLSNAARDGVRVMSLQNDRAEARAAVKNAAFGLDIADTDIDVEPSNCAPTDSTPTATVTVTYPFELLSGYLPLNDFTLTGTGSMRCNG
ncbi:TadE/TadG family type IV pilus assembly protein [Dietzia natronolimnaea]|uniref:TadE/TadG family type IV pilus assembly protein n=1 Tax=Dietzia natronolimnaea TaxID=161920 RepID=UPI0015FE1335|nr:TadE/TadG family type IV pilus assembly protein [Dietzia natronolimnaea]MBB1036965.1 pilus assembly protein [Dietzia natronolimnaea]